MAFRRVWGRLWCSRPGYPKGWGTGRQAGRPHHKLGGEPKLSQNTLEEPRNTRMTRKRTKYTRLFSCVLCLSWFSLSSEIDSKCFSSNTSGLVRTTIRAPGQLSHLKRPVTLPDHEFPGRHGCKASPVLHFSIGGGSRIFRDKRLPVKRFREKWQGRANHHQRSLMVAMILIRSTTL